MCVVDAESDKAACVTPLMVHHGFSAWKLHSTVKCQPILSSMHSLELCKKKLVIEENKTDQHNCVKS